MLEKLFYRSAFAEVLTRRILARFPKLKKILKKKRKRAAITQKTPFNAEQWDNYRKAVDEAVEDNSIVLVHASMDGLNHIGANDEIVFDLLSSMVNRGVTVVSTAYPTTNLNVKDKRMKPYNPEKTPCWTGMLSNRFVASPLTIRSTVPYNSLAAMGPLAQEMMADNLEAEYVYGDHTPWKYCVEHHARILFLGTTSLDANTIQSHMLADYMGDRWPINNWYEEYDAPLKINGEVIEHKLKVQNYEWAKYIADYSTTRKLREKGFLKEYRISGCAFEYITDAYEMVKYLEAECEKGKLMYLIPRKYRKKGWKKK